MKLLEFSVLVILCFMYSLFPVNAQGGFQLGDCSPNPCQNNGRCLDFFGQVYSCICQNRHTGDNCEILRPCYSNPCQNGGECIDNEPHFLNRTCICMENNGGQNCELVYPCASDPCQNGGTCSNTEDLLDFTCECPPTHMGQYCQYGAINVDGVCGTTPAAPPLPRFFGGKEAGLGNWPWQGYIEFARGNNYGVTLISDQWAITSAGNTEYLSTITAMDEVVFGDVFQGEGEEVSNYRQVAIVESVYTFPGLNYFTFDGDAQLLKFAEPLEITDFVRPICLPSEDVNEVEYYDVCWVAGWGLNEDGEVNTLLEQAKTYLIGYENCSEIIKEFGGPNLITERMICSTVPDDGVGPCVGDGGNAVSCAKDGVWEVVGIVSFGYACGDPEVPTGSWRTASYLDFIESIISGPEDQGSNSLCEPIELEECEDLLPYSTTFKTSQYSFTNLIYTGLEIAAESIDLGYCDAGELKSLLCALSLGECREDGPSMIICRDYCEHVQYSCNLTDSLRMCGNLPYGDYGQKWCYKGEDLSCGYSYQMTNASESVQIDSPGFPKSSYPSIRRCFWNVTAPEGYVLQMKFGFLEIDTDADFLSIGEGNPYDLTTTSLRVDGSSAPSIWTSESNSVWVRFQTTDDPAEGPGFSLYFDAVPVEGRECEDTDIFCDDTCYPYVIACDFISDCMDGTDEEGCNEIEVPSEGVNFVSPFYPAPGYPSNFEYTWTVSAPPGYYVGLDFSSVDLEDGADFLRISASESDEPLYEFTGYLSLVRILPAYETLCVTLVADDSNYRNAGFAAFAYSSNASAAEEECEEDYEFDCGDGVCLTLTVVCDGYEQCANGADEELCPPTTCYDGREIPYGEACNFGWFCEYGEDESSCPPRELGDKVYINAPRNPYNYSEYLPNSEMLWTITAEEGLSLAISFEYFALETNYDFWILGLGNEPSEAYVTNVFTGYYTPDPILVDSNEMFVHFISDSLKNTGGVAMKVRVVDKAELLYCEKGTFVHEQQICNGFWDCFDGRDEQDCEPIERLEPVEIAVPGWPLLYQNNAEYKWTFKTQEGLKIYLELPDFNTEEDYDVLRVGSGTSCEEDYFREDSGVIRDDYVVLSEDETLCLYFTSDYSVSFRGFYGGLTAVNESDYYFCPEDDQEVIFLTKVCDYEWNCPLSGQDEQDCPQLPLGESVELTSLDFPANYPPNASIIWSGTTDERYVAMVNFYEFDLEEDVDFLTIGCGDDPYDESSIVAILTGDDVPESQIFNCSALWLWFESDGQGFNRGYSGSITIVDPNAVPGDCVVPPGTPSEEVCELVYKCEAFAYADLECSVISEKPYTISSPNYPENYNDSAKIISVFVAPEGYRLRLNITDLALEAFFDYLSIGAELDASEVEFLERLTGDDVELPFILTSPGQTLFLVFESDEAIGDRGYYGTVMAVPDDDLVICNDGELVPMDEICNYEWYCDDGRDERDCRAVPIGAQGELYLPGYPEGEDYENNLNITWTFVSEPGSKFVVTVDKLDLEDGFDFLRIGYGFTPDENSALGVFTGGMENIPDEPLTTPSNELWVTFSSDDAFNLKGFFANIFIVSVDIDVCRPPPDSRPALVCEVLSECDEFEGDLTCELLSEEEEVQISSPNYPYTYNDSTTIASVFVAPRGYRLLVNITEFALEAFFDYLTIKSKVAPDAEEYLERLTGNELDLPITLVSPGQTLLLKFESDDAVGDMGYYGTVSLISEDEFLICDGTRMVPPEEICNYRWYCYDGADEKYCDPSPIGAGGPLSSPGYEEGEDYPNDQNITWSFKSVPGSNFMVTINDLDVEYSFDFLVIGYGIKPSEGTILAKLTGSIDNLNDTVIETPENELWIQFMSDDSFNGDGFHLTILITDNFGLNCSDGSMVSASSICNYIWDCPNGADEEDCDILQESEYALIYTPNYPDEYPSNANISWVIQAEEGLILLVNFTDFQTEAMSDVVAVGEGAVPCILGTLIDKFSGLNIPRDVLSGGNAMWITFTSDADVNFSGFFANISAVSADDFNTCYDGSLIPPSEICNYRWWCESGVDERGYDISCPTLGLGTRTNFSSPDYPYLFPEDSNITWTFIADPGLQFNVTIPEFEASNGSLTIGSGVDPTDADSVILTLSNYVGEETNVVLPGNEMWARFYGPYTGFGFIADVVTLLPGQGDNAVCEESNPCPVGSECVAQYDGSALCQCPDGFLYEPDIECPGIEEVCTPETCLNGGTCSDDSGTPYCLCPDGYGGLYCDRAVVDVTGPCVELLNYAQAYAEPLFNLTIDLPKNVVADFIISPSCTLTHVRRSVCAILYPSADSVGEPQGPCAGACENFSMCPNVGILIDYNCSQLDYTQSISGLPGLCTRA